MYNDRINTTIQKWRMGHSEELLNQSKTEILKDKLQIHSLKSLSLVSKRSTLPALLPTIYISLLGWFYPMCAALLGRYLIALASITSWEVQHNLGPTLIASCNDLSRPPTPFYVQTVMCCLGTRGSLKIQRKNPSLFLSLMCLKSAPFAWHCRVRQASWAGHWSPWVTLVAALFSCLPGADNP